MVAQRVPGDPRLAEASPRARAAWSASSSRIEGEQMDRMARLREARQVSDDLGVHQRVLEREVADVEGSQRRRPSAGENAFVAERETGASVGAIIPAHNAEAYLRDAIDSVLAQSHPVVDCVVVDDGSTDATAAIAEAYGPPVRVVRQENRGVSAARNRGAAEAEGALLAFLDADDRWLPDRLKLRRRGPGARGRRRGGRLRDSGGRRPRPAARGHRPRPGGDGRGPAPVPGERRVARARTS